MQKEHGEKGHLNVYIKDQDSHVTGFGVHARIAAGWCAEDQCFYVREDFVHGLQASTDAQRQKVIRDDFTGWILRRSARLVCCSSVPFENLNSIEHVYRIVYNSAHRITQHTESLCRRKRRGFPIN